MSGHSKWATIHRQKEITDAKRGSAWTKITNAIIVAVRETGIGDPESNFKLRMAIEKGRTVNMPNENIKRAIDKGMGAGGSGEKWEEITYEGFGPSGVAVMIEATTDNNKRTVQEIKNYLDKAGGKLVGSGGVSFQFQQKGLIIIDKPANSEEAILSIIDMGADDVIEEEDGIEVYTDPSQLEEIKKQLIVAGHKIKSFELIMKPINFVKIEGEESGQKILSFIERLEELNDVQKVFSNFEY
jgi:YebC/PmpR family DNA-binding regulatory protein